MKRALRPSAINLVTAGAATVLLLPASLCLAAQTAAELPWDRTLLALQDMLTCYVAPPAIALAFSSAVVLYALGGHDKQAGRLVGSGIGGCVALAVVYLLNYVLP